MSDVILYRAQDSLSASKHWRGAAFQHLFFMLSHSGLLTNTHTWKFSKLFSALDWNISVFFFCSQVKNNNWKVFVQVGVQVLFPGNRNYLCGKWRGWIDFNRVRWRPVTWPGFRQDSKVYMYKRIFSSNTCGTSIFQVRTWPPHFSKRV